MLRSRLVLACLLAPLWLAACANLEPSRGFDAGETAAAGVQRPLLRQLRALRPRRRRARQLSLAGAGPQRTARPDLAAGADAGHRHGHPSGATLDLPNQPPRNAPQVDSLLEDALGFALPVAGLRDWLHARPSRGSPAAATRDEQGRPATLQQNGWTVRYVSWQDAAAAGAQPRRIDLARDGSDHPLSVRPVLDPEDKP